MSTITRTYRILEILTKANLDARIKAVLGGDPNAVPTYSLKGAYCYAWVKHVLADIGVVQQSFDSIDAWDFFAGLPPSNMKYFDRSFSDTGGSESYPYHEVIGEKAAFVFGFFPKSKYRARSISIIEANDPNGDKIKKLTSYKRKGVSEKFQPITHIGIYANGLFYDFVANKVRINPKSSFVPIAYYCFYRDLLSKLP